MNSRLSATRKVTPRKAAGRVNGAPCQTRASRASGAVLPRAGDPGNQVHVEMEASGHARWFERLLSELHLVADGCRLARHALPLAAPPNPGIGKTIAPCKFLSFIVCLNLVFPDSNGNIAVQVNHHLAVAEKLNMIVFVFDMSQPLSLVHKASSIVCEIEYFRKHQT
jgi:hypothetical protein